MDKILAVILTGFCMHERRNTIERTWGKDIDHIYYSDHEAENIIKVTNETEYRFAELKQVNIINMFPQDLLDKYQWLIFTDDDTFVNVKLLKNLLHTFDKNFIYGKTGNSWCVDYSLRYMSGGAGFLISTKLLNLVKGKIPYLGTGYGDVTLGIFFRDNNIHIMHSELFRSHPPAESEVLMSDVKNYLTFHYIKTFSEMNELHNRCNNQ